MIYLASPPHSRRVKRGPKVHYFLLLNGCQIQLYNIRSRPELSNVIQSFKSRETTTNLSDANSYPQKEGAVTAKRYTRLRTAWNRVTAIIRASFNPLSLHAYEMLNIQAYSHRFHIFYSSHLGWAAPWTVIMKPSVFFKEQTREPRPRVPEETSSSESMTPSLGMQYKGIWKQSLPFFERGQRDSFYLLQPISWTDFINSIAINRWKVDKK